MGEPTKPAWFSPYPSGDNRGGWRGANYYLYRSLSRYLPGLAYVGDLQVRPDIQGMLLSRALTCCTGKRLLWSASNRTLQRTARVVLSRLEQAHFDPVLFFGSASFLKTFPCARYACFLDSALVPYLEFYETGRRYARFELRRLESLEKKWLHGCASVFTSSDYASQSIIDRYGLPAEKVITVGIGPNFTGDVEFKDMAPRQPTIFFPSTDFKRKRGELAIAVAALVHQKLPRVTFHLVGDHPSSTQLPAFIHGHGWLDRSKPEQAETYCELMRTSSILLSLSAADLTPIAICDSMAYGLPVLAVAIGGIPEMVLEGQTGWLVGKEATAGQIADHLVKVLSDPQLIARCSRASRRLYETTWNWDAVGRKMAAYLQTGRNMK